MIEVPIIATLSFGAWMAGLSFCVVIGAGIRLHESRQEAPRQRAEVWIADVRERIGDATTREDLLSLRRQVE